MSKNFDLEMEMPTLGQRAEIVAAWYFRFNGYFPLTGFVLQDAGAEKQPGQQLTDADVLAIRLPYAEEIIKGKHRDKHVLTDGALDLCDGVTDFIIAEVTSLSCKLNWLQPNAVVNPEFLAYMLRRFGHWRAEQVESIADTLSHEHRYKRNRVRVRLISVGMRTSDSLPGSIIQITLHDILRYLQRHFSSFDAFAPPERPRIFRPFS